MEVGRGGGFDMYSVNAVRFPISFLRINTEFFPHVSFCFQSFNTVQVSYFFFAFAVFHISFLVFRQLGKVSYFFPLLAIYSYIFS